MMPRARRSLTEPIGLNASSLTYRFTWAGASFESRTSGVLPTVSRMLLNFAGTRRLQLEFWKEEDSSSGRCPSIAGSPAELTALPAKHVHAAKALQFLPCQVLYFRP